MNAQVVLMVCIALLCWISAYGWTADRETMGAAFAFFGFGWGYVGLAILFSR